MNVNSRVEKEGEGTADAMANAEGSRRDQDEIISVRAVTKSAFNDALLTPMGPEHECLFIPLAGNLTLPSALNGMSRGLHFGFCTRTSENKDSTDVQVPTYSRNP